MGQQSSKKSKKNSKDKDKDQQAEFLSLDPSTPSEDTPHSMLSRATGSTSTSNSSSSDSKPILNGNPAVNISDPQGALPSKDFNARADASPYPSQDPSPNTSVSGPSSPLPSPRPPVLPLDLPTQTILANNNTVPPVSPNIQMDNGVPKDKQKQLDIDDMIQRLLDVGYTGKVSKSLCLKNAEITAICAAAREVFLSQPTLVELSPPVKIVGDVHGQYSDLIRLFEMCGFPPAANYLFLGDYVDRGKQSLETILLLLCYKIKYPENFFLLRGNHECANVTRVYGFYDECKRRCNIKIWKTFIDVFNCLPIAAIVASKIFCVHGGLSPSLHAMEDIKRIQRPTDVPDYGLLNDLLWSDPSDTALDWEDNERGVSYCFGKGIINEFLVRYDMDLICRAHMVVEDGYEFWNERTLVTVFSAPNYCGEFDNYGACMSVSEDLLCAFELLKPLDGAALRKEMTKAKRKSLVAA